jgi:hypothetical protein
MLELSSVCNLSCWSDHVRSLFLLSKSLFLLGKSQFFPRFPRKPSRLTPRHTRAWSRGAHPGGAPRGAWRTWYRRRDGPWTHLLSAVRSKDPYGTPKCLEAGAPVNVSLFLYRSLLFWFFGGLLWVAIIINWRCFCWGCPTKTGKPAHQSSPCLRASPKTHLRDFQTTLILRVYDPPATIRYVD